MKQSTFILLFVFVALFFSSVNSWRRRRRRRCYRNCSPGSWGRWTACTRTCGGGTQYRTRGIAVPAQCGGSCNVALRVTRNCNTHCCRVNCAWSWNAWSPCLGCGTSTQRRTIRITRNPSCGGTACPTKTSETRSCNTGVCCPVNCVVNAWSSWGSCNAACERSGQRTRTRSIRTQQSCRGTPCPSLRETKSCNGPCCARDCKVSSWTTWGACSAPSGKCGPTDGTRIRKRLITSQATCGGRACPSLSESARCKPVPIPCKMSSWSTWSSCSPNNNKCGAGTQYRTRTVVTNPYCSSPCPSVRRDIRSCTHSCCPVNCVVSTWTAWSACSSTCGSGTKTRTRQVTTQAYCGGNACPSLRDASGCTQYKNRDCVVSPWSAWSQCSNGCGNGWSTRRRSIVKQAVCRGKACGTTTESKRCSDYRDNRDCVVSNWGPWGSCSEKCAVGSKQRTRSVTVAQRCQGRSCPALKQPAQCGTPNNGCQHTCSNGICSCRAGYYLASDKKNCIAKDCKIPSPKYCKPGTALGSTCKYAIVTCPGGKTTYPVSCPLSCPKFYSIKGASSVTCQTSGQWTSYATSFCRRNNDPPIQIILSGSASIPENKPRVTLVGNFSTVDPNSKDKHTYSIVSGASGRFELRGADLYTRSIFDYEASPNRFSIVVRSTDNGSPPMNVDKTFTISVIDVNEAPTGIQLSSATVNENSDMGTVVGKLSTADPDKGQTYSYSLLENAGGRFKIQGTFVKVAPSSKNCLANGGPHCLLNYEAKSSYVIKVRSVDSGSPAKSITTSIKITLNDVNDKPRDLKLSNYAVKENAPLKFKIGSFSATDEDKGQTLSFALVDDDGGRFTLDGKNGLLKAKATDYETSQVHNITVKVTDNGIPTLSITKRFSIVVLNVNEAPVSIVLDNTNIPENSKPGTRVGTLTARDTDAVQSLTFKLDDDSGGQLSLETKASCQTVNPTGTICTTGLLVSGVIDYEDESSLDIIVRATDNNGLFHTSKITLTVIDMNDPPKSVTLDGSTSASVPENSRDSQIAVLQTADEDQGQNHTYVLTSSGGNFEVRGDKLFTSKNANLNFEASSNYSISVRSTDDGKPPMSVTKRLTVNVQNINEKPTNIILSKKTIEENKVPGTVIGQLAVSDPDAGQSHVCSLTDSAGGAVALSRNQLTVGSAGVNYERNSTLTVGVTCRDPGGLTVQKSFVIIVQNINEAPSSITLSNTQVRENQRVGTIVGKLTVADPDNLKAQVQSFSLSISSSNPNQPFQIKRGYLTTSRQLDFEKNAQWTLQIVAQDNGTPSLSRTQTFTIQVTDMNDAPNGILLSNAAVNENSDLDTLIGTLTSLDQDTSQNYSYQLLNSASGRFKLDGNKIKVAVSNKQCLSQGGSSCLLNFESQKSFTIRVKTTDNGTPQLSYEKDFTIDLLDVNDKPRDLRLSSNEVKENAPNNTLIGRFAADDEDSGQSLKYSLTNDDNGRFRVDPRGNLYKAKDVNYETQQKHVIKALVQDNGNPVLKMEKSFTIEVLDINEAPIGINITSQGGQLPFIQGHAQIKENSANRTVVGQLIAFDQDLVQQLVFRLDDDAGGRFTLGSSLEVCQAVTNISGVKTKCFTSLYVNTALDYEQSTRYYITLRVTDNKGLFATSQIKIAIVDENDPPQNITLGGSHIASVNENANGALIGQLATSDQDVAQTHTYKLLDDAAGRFVVQSDKLYVSSSANLDYETSKSFAVKVQSTDNGTPSLSVEQSFQIIVLDINEAPVNITLTPANVTENSKSGTLIGRLSVKDPDNYGSAGNKQTLTCQVTGNLIGQFIIDSDLLKVGSASLDYEQVSVIDVEVKCTDNGSPPLSLVKVLSIDIDDINETPTSITLSVDVIAENQPPSVIGTFSTADPDNTNQLTDRQTFTYTIMGNTTGLPFTIDGNALKSTRSLDFETQSSWQVTVTSLDSGTPQLSVVSKFNITVIDVNEKPYNITLSNSVIDENPAQDTIIGSLSSSDPDVGQTHTYTLIDGAGGRFKLQGNQVKVALSNDDCLKYGRSYCKLNYEKQRSYTISVRAVDDGTPPQYNETNFTIYLTDVNDRPRDLKLSSSNVKENAPVGTKIGRFSATDEDASQTLNYLLVDDDGGRFKVNSSGYLLKANDTDYETNKVHRIVAQVKDNGNPSLEINKTFIITVLNVNEGPINTTLSEKDGQQTFPDNAPKVDENSVTNTTVGTLQALDHDAIQNLRFTLDDDASGKFTVGSTVTCHNNTNIPGVKTMCTTLLLVSGALNYEESTSEDILVRVTDNKGLFHVQRYQVTILDVNDPPSNVTLGGGDMAFIDENINNGLIGELATVDEDAGQTHSYSLINNGGWKFSLRNDKVYTSNFANLDYERQSIYTITVRSIDDGNPKKALDKTFTVKIRDVNERPRDIILSTSSVAENSPHGTLVGNLSVMDPDDMGPRGPWQNHSCSVTNPAGTPFAVNITNNLNTLVVAGNLNYEQTRSYDIDIGCYDSGIPSLYFKKTLTVVVLDVNEKPYDITLSSTDVLENAGIVTVGILNTADPDNEQTVVQTFNYSITGSPGSIPFVIDGDKLNTTASLDYETRDSWSLAITSTDNKGLSTTKNFTISVVDRNDPPSAIAVSGPLEVNEDSSPGEFIASITTADQDVGQTHQYEIVDVAGYGNNTQSNAPTLRTLFAVESPSGRVSLQKSGLDYEKYTNYTVTVNSTDSGYPPYSVTGSFMISVNNINEIPHNVTLSANKVPENSPVGTIIGYLSVYDPDNLHMTLQKFDCRVTNGVPFAVKNHLTLTVSENALDYESTDQYIVDINCTELLPSPLSIASSFTVSILDVNEAPYNLSISSTTLKENGFPGDVVGVLSVEDPDTMASGNSRVSLSISNQSPSTGVFNLNGSALVTNKTLDFEAQSLYNVTVVATDSGDPPLTTSLPITIEVIDTNDPPTAIDLTSAGIYENATVGTLIGILRAPDEDVGQTHFFSFVNQPDSYDFKLNGSLFELNNLSLDYETSPAINLTLNATDSGLPNLSVQDTVTIKVLDSNDPPSDILIQSSFTVLENSPVGTPVANLSVLDEDAAQNHSCILVNGGDYFVIFSLTESSSEIRVKQNAGLDYENMPDTTIRVSVKCQDDGNPSYSVIRNFSVSVIDVNEAPFNITLNGSNVVEESVRAGYPVGDLTCQDPDFGQSHVFNVIGNYSSVFQVNSSNNVLTVKDPSYLDYEHLPPPALLSVTIKVTDIPGNAIGDAIEVTADVIINITDVNEAPYDIKLIPQNVTVAENASIGYCIAQITSKNPESWQRVDYTLLNLQDTFKIEDKCENDSVGSIGQSGFHYLTVKSYLSYNDYSKGYVVLIGAEDNGIPPQSFNSTVTVNVTMIDPCQTSACHVNAFCNRIDWQNYTCTCNEGYSGTGYNCTEIDECQSNPCHFNGTCHDYVNFYNCTCPSGFHNGSDCVMINYCASNPCRNGASCFPDVNRYSCSCAEGFTGVLCETNIDDCESVQCVHGKCKDGVARFTCECEEGFYAPLCERNAEDCPPERCDQDHICVPPITNVKETTHCFPKDFVVSLELTAGANTSDTHWQYELEQFIKGKTFPYRDILDNEDDATDVTVRDVYFIPVSSERDSRAKRNTDKEGTTSTDFMVFVEKDGGGDLQAVPVITVLCGLNNTCQPIITDRWITSKMYKVCSACAEKVANKQIETCGFQDAADVPLKSQKHSSSLRLYYVIAGIGGILLIGIVAGILLCRRNSLNDKERKLIVRERSVKSNDETYTDIMYRHHMANQQLHTEGAFNPMFGTGEEEVEVPVVMLDNPIYEDPAKPRKKREKPATGFDNPMYSSYKPEESHDVGELEQAKDEDNVGFANPLFTKSSKEKHDTNEYAVPIKPGKDDVQRAETAIYNALEKSDISGCEEPQVVAASGFFNPLYQSREEVEEFPDDISSIFATPKQPPMTTVDDDSRQSEC